MRIGCSVEGRCYVVPTAYAYDGNALYSFSHEGMKMQMMRANPRACVEIDSIQHLGGWTSVIAWGTFEELAGEEKARGSAIAMKRLAELISDAESVRRLEEAMKQQPEAIVFRIKLDEKTGKTQ
jgi:hypothetical protein